MEIVPCQKEVENQQTSKSNVAGSVDSPHVVDDKQERCDNVISPPEASGTTATEQNEEHSEALDNSLLPQNPNGADTLEESDACESCTRLVDHIDDLRVDFDENNYQLQEALAEFAKEEKEHTRTQEKLNAANAKVNELNKKIRKQSTDYKKEIATQAIDFAAVKRDLTAKIERQVYPCHPDDVLREKFRGLLSKCDAWVKRWQKSELTKSDVESLLGILCNCATTQDDNVRQVLHKRLLEKDKKPARAAIFAAVTRKLLFTVFGNPFFALQNARKSLKKTQEYFGKGDQKKACAWRAETVRLIRAQMGVEQLELDNDTSESRQIQQTCAKKALDHVEQISPAMLRPVADSEHVKRLEALTGIWLKFQLLAFELWSQKCDITIEDIEETFSRPFSLTSRWHKPHISMGLDEEGNIFEGVPLQFVLTPAILVRGDASGNNMDTVKVISKACVYLIESLLPDQLQQTVSVSGNGNMETRKAGTTDDETKNTVPKKRKLSHASADCGSVKSSKKKARDDAEQKRPEMQASAGKEAPDAGEDESDSSSDEVTDKFEKPRHNPPSRTRRRRSKEKQHLDQQKQSKETQMSRKEQHRSHQGDRGSCYG